MSSRRRDPTRWSRSPGYLPASAPVAFDQSVGDVDELGIRLLGQFAQQIECGDCVEVEPFHQDSRCLTDEIPAGECTAELLVASHHVPGHRGVCREDQSQLDRLLVERVWRFGKEIERGEVVRIAEQPERDDGAHRVRRNTVSR